MTEQSPDTPEPGPVEQAVFTVLSGDWPALSIEQRGPDGTEVLGMLIFYACPVCHAVVPPETSDHDWAQGHAAYHLKQARDSDFVTRLASGLAGYLEDEREGGF